MLQLENMSSMSENDRSYTKRKIEPEKSRNSPKLNFFPLLKTKFLAQKLTKLQICRLIGNLCLAARQLIKNMRRNLLSMFTVRTIRKPNKHLEMFFVHIGKCFSCFGQFLRKTSQDNL